MSYTLGQVRLYLDAAARIRRERIVEAAIAARAGMTDAEGFAAFRKALESDVVPAQAGTQKGPAGAGPRRNHGGAA